jgi:hypothetical protein
LWRELLVTHEKLSDQSRVPISEQEWCVVTVTEQVIFTEVGIPTGRKLIGVVVGIPTDTQ